MPTALKGLAEQSSQLASLGLRQQLTALRDIVIRRLERRIELGDIERLASIQTAIDAVDLHAEESQAAAGC